MTAGIRLLVCVIVLVASAGTALAHEPDEGYGSGQGGLLVSVTDNKLPTWVDTPGTVTVVATVTRMKEDGETPEPVKDWQWNCTTDDAQKVTVTQSANENTCTFTVTSAAEGNHHLSITATAKLVKDNSEVIGTRWVGFTTTDPVKLVSLQVEGATQTNVTQPTDATQPARWAAVKAATGNVTITAVTDPANPPGGVDITWTGGEAVPGQPLQRKVSKATSAKTTVTAKLGNSTKSVDIWVIWATITLKTTGTTPANSAQFGTIRYPTGETLGEVTYGAAGDRASGKIAPYAVITPAGVKDVVKAGWDFRRDRISHGFSDGVKMIIYWDTNWTDDTSDEPWKRLTPDANDTIYDLDGPDCFVIEVDSYETYGNFRQRITWNTTACSDYVYWYYMARTRKSSSPVVQLNKLGANAQITTLPDENGAYYKRVSGTITLNGAGLAGVTVCCDGTIGTTAANGTYTIKTVPWGKHVITPIKIGYTFTPATLNVTVPSDAHVTGRDFTATQP